MKENLQRSYMVKGIIQDMQATIAEKPQHTFLGSTDRKGYTLKITLNYLDEYGISYIDVQPFDEMTKEITDRMIEEAKFRFAEQLYKKLFNTLSVESEVNKK